MPVATPRSMMRWLLPVGVVGIGLVALMPAEANVETAAVQRVSPADVAIRQRLNPEPPAPTPAVVEAAAPVDIQTEADPAWVAAVTSPRSTAPAIADWLPDSPVITVAALPPAEPVVEDTTDKPRLVARTGLNIRSGPSTDSARVTVLQPREPVVVMETALGWSRVRTESGIEGWAYSPLLADPSAPIAETRAPRRNAVRVEPPRNELAYEAPRRQRTTLFDYLERQGMVGR